MATPDAHRLVRVAPNVTRHAVLMEAAAYVRRVLAFRATLPVPDARNTYSTGFSEAGETVLDYLEAEAAKALDG